MVPRKMNSTTSKIILETKGPHKHKATSRVSISGISMPASTAEYFNKDIIQAVTNQNELCDLLVEKSKAPGLNQKVKTFINGEIQSLTQNPIPKDAIYVHLLSVLGSSAYVLEEDFLMEQIVDIRKSKQKKAENASPINTAALKK